MRKRKHSRLGDASSAGLSGKGLKKPEAPSPDEEARQAADRIHQVVKKVRDHKLSEHIALPITFDPRP